MQSQQRLNAALHIAECSVTKNFMNRTYFSMPEWLSMRKTQSQVYFQSSRETHSLNIAAHNLVCSL